MEQSKMLEKDVNTRIFASLLVAIAGVLLLSDKIFTFELQNNFGYNNTPAFIWSVVQIVSPVLVILATFFNPYKISYLIPVYLYSVQMCFVFGSESSDTGYVFFYAAGSVVAFLILIFFLNKVFRRNQELRNAKMTALESLLDLHIAIYAKK